ncbi:MAG: Ig-like domain-containing protein [Armatimonadota bacterium]
MALGLPLSAEAQRRPAPARPAPRKPAAAKPAPAPEKKQAETPAAAEEELAEPESPQPELYRVRVINSPGAAVEVSADAGIHWQPLGKVARAANAVLVSPKPLDVARPSSVAGVAADHLLIRVPGAKGALRALRILAAGTEPSRAAISTTIPAGGSLFRLLAPTPGSRVLLESPGGAISLPADYQPAREDRLLIVVPRPEPGDPAVVTLENREGGVVTLTAAGGMPRSLGTVKQPLRGIGRYTGTEQAGSGAVVGWSPTAVMVATAGRARLLDENGQLGEQRGGFVIQPAEPELTGTTNPASQILVEAPKGEGAPAISPLFSLPALLSSGDPLDTRPTRVDVRIDGGEWEPLPDLRGALTEEELAPALRKALGEGREVKDGITHLRLSFGTVPLDTFERRIALATTPLEAEPQRGQVTIAASVEGEGITFVSFLLNGVQTTITNVPPYEWDWDTTGVPNGEHLVTIRGLDAMGGVVVSLVKKVLVDN